MTSCNGPVVKRTAAVNERRAGRFRQCAAVRGRKIEAPPGVCRPPGVAPNRPPVPGFPSLKYAGNVIRVVSSVSANMGRTAVYFHRFHGCMPHGCFGRHSIMCQVRQVVAADDKKPRGPAPSRGGRPPGAPPRAVAQLRARGPPAVRLGLRRGPRADLSAASSAGRQRSAWGRPRAASAWGLRGPVAQLRRAGRRSRSRSRFRSLDCLHHRRPPAAPPRGRGAAGCMRAWVHAPRGGRRGHTWVRAWACARGGARPAGEGAECLQDFHLGPWFECLQDFHLGCRSTPTKKAPGNRGLGRSKVMSLLGGQAAEPNSPKYFLEASARAAEASSRVSK